MQAITISVGPVTAAVTTQVAASQTPNAGQLALNGAGATFSINNIAAAQDPAAAGNLTLVSSPVTLPLLSFVYVTSAANDTAFTFTITGLDVNGKPQSEVVTGGNIKAVVTTRQFTVVSNVAVSGNAGSVQVGSFSGAAFTGATTRQVTITSAGNDSVNTFVVTGTGPNNEVISESITGPNTATVTTTAYFRTVTSVTISGNAVAAITVGMTNTASSRWVRFDDFAPSNISLQCSVSGSATYTVQSTLDDPNDPFNPVLPGAVTWVSTSDTNVVAATTTQQSNFLFAPRYARIILTTTSTGSVTMTALQSSNGPK
tara:strand:- start:23 stop:967 length:945 start_codon:yes stop_codon:yes gene_type:complete